MKCIACSWMGLTKSLINTREKYFIIIVSSYVSINLMLYFNVFYQLHAVYCKSLLLQYLQRIHKSQTKYPTSLICTKLSKHTQYLYYNWAQRIVELMLYQCNRILSILCIGVYIRCKYEHLFLGLTWGPPGSCRPQMRPMLAPRTLLSG